MHPRLACEIDLRDGEIVLARDGLEYALAPEDSPLPELQSFLRSLDGRRSLGELQEALADAERARLLSMVDDLEMHNLIDDARPVVARSGIDVLLELEDLTNELIERTLEKNVFWTTVRKPGVAPKNVLYGFAVENYHFLFRESLFDSPILAYPGNTRVRTLINEFYVSEFGHDELVVQALSALGITREELLDAIPLPETMAMCNALSYWASSDPIFFLSTLGVLEGKDTEEDPYIHACEINGLEADFIGPMRAHSEINRNAAHGDLTREIFREIPHIDAETIARARRQMPLFIEMYDNYHTALWNHYSKTDQLLRRVSRT